MEKKIKAKLILEDGTEFTGYSFGADGAENSVAGEVVFNTGMMGYPESLTDPSYKGQILTMTYPLIGNYGVRRSFFESDKIQVEGFIVREHQDFYSHRNAVKNISQFLKEFDVPGISGILVNFRTSHLQNFLTSISLNLNLNLCSWLQSLNIDFFYPVHYN